MSQEYADPDCRRCGGSGWLYAPSMLTLPGERGGRYCDCAADHMRLVNMERIWKSLSEASMPKVLRDDPPLKRFLKANLWLTAKEVEFRAHLKALAFNMHDMWDARVYSDKDLLKAWLNTAYAQGHKIYDTELSESMVTVKAMYIDELVEPPELVILMLGVKQAPNKETPNVLLEAIRSRLHIGKPMWIVDQPDARVDQMHHRGYSEQLEGLLSHWPHLRVSGRSLLVASGAVERVQEVASTPEEVEEIVEDEVEGAAEIDEALADLDEAEDDEVPADRPNLLDQIVENEEEQEKRARTKSSKSRSSKPRGKGGRRR